MQTSVVDYIFEQLEDNSLFFRGTDNELNISISASDYLDLKRLAKEMFKKSIIDAANITKEDRWYRADKYANCGEKYYDKYYGSKGSDEYTEINWGGVIQKIPIETNGNNVEKVPNVTSSQTEISDEEIDKFFNEELKSDEARIFAKGGAKWYREQLKQK